MAKSSTILSTGLLALVIACGSTVDTQGMDKDQIEDAAEALFQRESWYEVSQIYTELMYRYPGAADTDLYLYRLAIAEREQDHWADAAFYLSRVTNEFPRSRLADDAQLELARTYWMQKRDYRRDLTPVTDALEELARFYERFPGSELISEAEMLRSEIHDHLARRALFIGRFYSRRNRHDAALLYLREAVEKYDSPSCLGEIYLTMADIYREKENLFSARDYYQKALDCGGLDSEQTERAQQGLDSI